MEDPVYSLLFDQSLISPNSGPHLVIDCDGGDGEEQEVAIKTERLSANIFLYPTFLITAVSSVPCSAQRAAYRDMMAEVISRNYGQMAIDW